MDHPRDISLRTPVAILVGLAVLTILTLAVAPRPVPYAAAHTPVSGSTTPPLSAHIRAVLAASRGFQYVVSYTDRGFEPSTLIVKKGETVRFVNNSTHDLWVAATGGGSGVYPANSKSCGQSVFDSCATLPPGDFWEITFDVVGMWNYIDNLHKNATGIIRVQ